MSQIIKSEDVDSLLDSYFRLYDYILLDISKFLQIEKKYTKLLYIKNSLFLASISTFTGLILVILFVNEYKTIFFLFTIIAVGLIVIFDGLEAFIYRFYNASKRFYRKQWKYLTQQSVRVKLLLNNHIVIKCIEENEKIKFSNSFHKEKIDEISQGLYIITNSFKSFKDYFKQFSIFSILATSISLIITILSKMQNANFFSQKDLGLGQISELLIAITILGQICVHYLILGAFRMIKLKKKRPDLKKIKEELEGSLITFNKILLKEFKENSFPKMK